MIFNRVHLAGKQYMSISDCKLNANAIVNRDGLSLCQRRLVPPARILPLRCGILTRPTTATIRYFMLGVKFMNTWICGYNCPAFVRPTENGRWTCQLLGRTRRRLMTEEIFSYGGVSFYCRQDAALVS